MGNVAQLASSQIDSAYKKVEAAFRESIAKGHEKPNFAEIQLAAIEMGWDHHQTGRQFNRVLRVMRHEVVAGSKKDREALEKNLDEATKAVKTTGKKLQSKIDALQKELADLEAKRNGLEKQFTGATQAAEHLQDLLPEHIEMKLSHQRGSLNGTLRSEIHAAENEIRQTEHLLELADSGKTTELAEKLRFFQGGELSKVVVKGNRQERKLSPEWPAYAKDLRDGLAADKEAIAEMRAKYDVEIAKIMDLKDWYIK